jgi:pimeloyl-ACP methyl ester carboxylesterase
MRYRILLFLACALLGIFFLPQTTRPTQAEVATATMEATEAPTPADPIPVQFKGADDLTIYALKYAAPKEPAPALLLIHEQGGRKEEWVYWVNKWVALGINVYAIDRRGFGQTKGVENNAKSEQDIANVLTQISADPDVTPHQIAILGGSMGGGFALTGCAQFADCKTAILLSAATYKSDLTDPIAALGNRPLFLAVSDSDAPFNKVAKDYADRAKGEHKLIVYDGYAHATVMLFKHPELVDLISDWLTKYLINSQASVATPSATGVATPQ